MPRMRRSLRNGSPPNPPVANERSRSQRLRPWVVTSRSACLRCRYSSGSVSAMRWPRTRYAWISSWTRATLLMSSSWVAEMSWTQRIGS